MRKTTLDINWKRFNGYTFQDMCNHLLVAENINVVPFKSGPYADKGQDARLFEGSINGIDGRIIFQSKYHEPSPKRANLNALKKDIRGTPKEKGELDKAEESKADHLIIMTNVTLTHPGQHDELEVLAEGRRVELHIWDEEKIIALLINNPYVRFFHIKGPDYPMFVPHDHFFERFLRDNPKDILTHLTKLSGRKTELQDCKKFLSSKANLLMIYGAPGQGKSRLALEFSRLTQEESDWVPMFVRPEGKLLKDHLEELNPYVKYLLFMEDAHQFYERLKEFTNLLYGGTDIPEIKLVLTARNSLIGIVEQAFEKLQPFDSKEIRIPELKQDEILNILADQLPEKNEFYLKDLLPFVKDSPLLAVAASKLLKMGKPLAELLKPGQLRKQLFEFPLEDLTKFCIEKGESAEHYKKILSVIAAIQPFHENHKELVIKVSDYLNLKKHEFVNAVDKLTQFGFIKRIGRKVRLTPEIFSDIILEKQCLTSTGESNGYGEELADHFFDYSFEQLLNNLCDVGEITFHEQKPDILRNVFDKIKKKVLKSDDFERAHIIEQLNPVGIRRASDVLDIINIILDNPNEEEHSNTSYEYLIDKIYTILGTVARNYEAIPDVLHLLFQLNSDVTNRSYMGDTPLRVLKDIMSYDIGKPIVYQEKALDTLAGWREKGTEAYVFFIVSIEEIFRSSVSFSRAYGPSVTFGNISVPYNTAIARLRKKALKFLTEALNSGIKSVQLTSLETTSKIGSSASGPQKKASYKMSKLIENERLHVINAFQDLITSPDIGLVLNGKTETILWNWWWSNPRSIAQKCFNVLKKIKQSDKYRLFKLLYVSNCPISIDLIGAGKKLTIKERNSYYFCIKREERERSRDFIKELIDNIGNLSKYDFWYDLLNEFHVEALNVQETWIYRVFISILSGTNADLGYRLYEAKSGKPWENYGSAILSGIRDTDKPLWETHLNKLMEAGENRNESAICDSINAIYGQDLSSFEIDFLKKYSNHESENVRMTIAQNLVHISGKSWFLIEALAANLITHNCPEKLLDDVCGSLLHYRPAKFLHFPTDVERDIIDKFSETDDLSEYCCQEFIAKFARKEPQLLLNLTKKRIDNRKSLYHLKDIYEKVAPDWKKRDDFNTLQQISCDLVKRNNNLISFEDRWLEPLYTNDIYKTIKDSIIPENPESILDAAEIASNLPKTTNFYEFFASLMRVAENCGDETVDKVANIFSSSLWTGVHRRAIGTPSELHISIKSECENILKSHDLSRNVQKVFENCIKGIDRAIQKDLNQDKELFEQ